MRGHRDRHKTQEKIFNGGNISLCEAVQMGLVVRMGKMQIVMFVASTELKVLRLCK